VLSVQELMGMEGNVVTMQEIFRFVPTGLEDGGRVTGYFEATVCRRSVPTASGWQVSTCRCTFSTVAAAPRRRSWRS
jgi:hypothetical protein